MRVYDWRGKFPLLAKSHTGRIVLFFGHYEGAIVANKAGSPDALFDVREWNTRNFIPILIKK